MLSKCKADKHFDKRDAQKFCVEAMKSAGSTAGNNMIGFDALFKEIDVKKRGYLELAQMTGLALRVCNFGKSKGQKKLPSSTVQPG